MDDTVQAYIAEMRDQIAIMSDRCAQLAAALRKEKADHELAQGRIRSLKQDADKKE